MIIEKSLHDSIMLVLTETVISEVFDSPYEYWQDPTSRAVFFFETDSGEEYMVRVTPGFTHMDSLEVSFAVRRNGAWTDGIVGLNQNSLRVISTVIAVVKEVVNRIKPKQVIFVSKSSETSRVKLYRKIAQAMDKKSDLYNFVKEFEDSDGIVFVLER